MAFWFFLWISWSFYWRNLQFPSFYQVFIINRIARYERKQACTFTQQFISCQFYIKSIPLYILNINFWNHWMKDATLLKPGSLVSLVNVILSSHQRSHKLKHIAITAYGEIPRVQPHSSGAALIRLKSGHNRKHMPLSKISSNLALDKWLTETLVRRQRLPPLCRTAGVLFLRLSPYYERLGKCG